MVMLEGQNQTVDGKAIQKGRHDLVKGGWAVHALAAESFGKGQRERTLPTVRTQPGQVGAAGLADSQLGMHAIAQAKQAGCRVVIN